MKKKPRRKPKVSYTITMNWTLKEATDFHRKEGTLNDRPLREFLEELEDEALFCDFIEGLFRTGCDNTSYDSLKLDYFQFVADQL